MTTGERRSWIDRRTRGERFRLAFSLLIVGLSASVALDTALLASFGLRIYDDPWMGQVLAGLSVFYFLIVIVLVIFRSSPNFRPQPFWLALDTVNSIVFCIFAFAILYRFEGISFDQTCPNDHRPTDYVYFSAVTFSTLGYGDFRPCEGARLYAAFHAIFGNLHLGLIVGCAFFFAQLARDGDGSGEGPTRDVTAADAESAATASQDDDGLDDGALGQGAEDEREDRDGEHA